MRKKRKMGKMKVYLSGAISGREFRELFNDWSEKRNILLGLGYDVLFPLSCKEDLADKDGVASDSDHKTNDYKSAVTSNHAIYNRDLWMVQSCDILFCDLSAASRVSIGSMFELAWASYLHKHIIVIMEDDSLHQHAFVRESANIVFNDFSQAIDYMTKLAK